MRTLAVGTHITRESPSRRLYRDSAGRARTERSLIDPVAGKRKADAPVIVEITDPVEHVKYTFVTANKVVVNKVAHKRTIAAPEPHHPVKRAATRAAAAAKPSQPSDDDAPQFTHEKLESQTMEGLLVEGTRDTWVYPTGSQGNDRPITMVNETWSSPELKVTVLATCNDPRQGESTQKLANIDRNEPDPSLFRPPADYTVVEEKGDFTIRWGSESQ